MRQYLRQGPRRHTRPTHRRRQRAQRAKRQLTKQRQRGTTMRQRHNRAHVLQRFSKLFNQRYTRRRRNRAIHRLPNVPGTTTPLTTRGNYACGVLMVVHHNDLPRNMGVIFTLQRAHQGILWIRFLKRTNQTGHTLRYIQPRR